MTFRRRRQFVHAQLAWMLGTIVVLSTLRTFSMELFFIVSLVGLLVTVELTAPVNVSPRWRARLKWILVLGMLGFGLFMAKRVVEFLPSELL